MKELQIEVRRAMQIAEAVKAIENNDLLPFKVSYWLGRLGDSCASIQTNFQKQQQKLGRAYREESQGRPKKDVDALVSKLEDDIEELLAQEETIKVYPFKLSDFVAGEDIKRGETITKKDSPLVTVKFFTLMGDLIEDEDEKKEEAKIAKKQLINNE